MGLFSSSKEKTEHKDTTDIKQATISDSQMNSMPSNQNVAMQQQQQQQQQMPMQNNAQGQPVQTQNFVNPFSQSGQQSSGQQNPFGNNNQIAQQTDFSDVMAPQNQQPMQGQNQFGGSLSQMNLSAMGGQVGHEIDFDKIQEMIDETVEKIIEDKWNMLEEKVNKVLRWKETKDAEINMLKEDLVALGEGFNKLEMKLINKISNYDKNILDVNSEIKALEKVFQKVTPTLINNVNELSKIADEFKGVKPRDRKIMTEDDFAIDEEPVNNRNRSNSKN